MQLLRAVLVTTSIADWTPSLDPIRATLQSLECLDAAETLVVADALPSEREAEALSPLDGDKWRQLYEEKAEAYDTYLHDLQELCDARPATTLLRQATFGHLVGSVRAGFNTLKCDADDVVLITQHDLALSRAPPVEDVCELLGEDDVDYVLLSRDADGAPRFVDWFYASPREFDGAQRVQRGLAAAVSLEGGYADQTHFSTRRWYDEQVFPLLPEGGTCMEHVLHPAPVAVWKSTIHGVFTPSTRRLLDGVAMPVAHCSTELSGAPDTLVDFTQAGVARRGVNPERRHVRARARAPFERCGPRPHHETYRKVPARFDVAARLR